MTQNLKFKDLLDNFKSLGTILDKTYYLIRFK